MSSETTIKELEKLVQHEYFFETDSAVQQRYYSKLWKFLKPHLTSLLTEKDKEIERLQGLEKELNVLRDYVDNVLKDVVGNSTPL